MVMNEPKAIHLLAGGNWRRRTEPDPLIAAALAAAGSARPRVGYIGAASGDDAGFIRRIAELFERAGSGRVTLAPLAGGRADPERARAVLRECDIVFVSGGDVEEGMRTLQGAGMVPFLGRLYRSGKPFFGLSAGSIMLASRWVRWRDPEDDATAESFPCLGLAPVLCDTHAEDDGWVELKALLRREGNGTRGYGIPSGCGLLVLPDGRCEGIGGPSARYVVRRGRVAREPDLAAPRNGG